MVTLNEALNNLMTQQGITNEDLSIDVFDSDHSLLISEIRSGLSHPIITVWLALFQTLLRDTEIFQRPESSVSFRQGDVLHQLRENAGLTLEELSNQLKEIPVEKSFIWDIERGGTVEENEEIKFIALVTKLATLNNIDDSRILLLYFETPTHLSFDRFLEILKGT